MHGRFQVLNNSSELILYINTHTHTEVLLALVTYLPAWMLKRYVKLLYITQNTYKHHEVLETDGMFWDCRSV